MKKLIFIFVLLVPIFSFQANSQDVKLELDSLNQKVDSLEHELSYLKLTYELNELSTNMRLLSDNICYHALAVSLDRVRKNYKTKLKIAYLEDYESSYSLKRSYSELYDSVKQHVLLVTLLRSFPDEELKIISSRVELITMQLDKLDSDLELYKNVIADYVKK